MEYQRLAPAEEWSEAETRIEHIDNQLQKKKQKEQKQEEQKQEEQKQEERTPPPAPTRETKLVVPAGVSYSLWGLGVVGLGSSIYFGTQSNVNRASIEENCFNQICSSNAQPLLQQQKSDALYSDIALGVGLSAIGTAIWLGFNPSSQQKIQVSPHHISLLGRF